QHVLDKTFRPARHHTLLAGPVVGWPSLAAIQAQYVAATSEPERRASAVAFLEAGRGLDRTREGDAEVEELHACFGLLLALPPVPMSFCRDERKALHYWRAVCATALHEHGYSTSEVADWLGTSSATVRRYIAWVREMDLAVWLSVRGHALAEAANRAAL